MKKVFKRFVFCIASFALCLSLFGCDGVANVRYTELGSPLSLEYEEALRAKCPWDLIIYDGELYVGGGDYGGNAGPVSVWKRNIKSRAWHLCGTVPDEEINRFCVLDGELVITGTDPMDDWSFGNYYTVSGDGVEVVRNIPYAVHNFDMLSHDGMIFAGLGVEPGHMPAAVSLDGGKSFSPVPFEKHGSVVDTSVFSRIRVYDLFLHGDNVYALAYITRDDGVSYELYRYESGSFSYEADWTDSVKKGVFSSNVIGAKANLGSGVIFTTGNLYFTDDMYNVSLVEMNGEMVYDIYRDGENLYFLTSKTDADGCFIITVRRYTGDGESVTIDDLNALFSFKYDVPPLSLAVLGSDYYIGVGHWRSTSEKNGFVLHIRYIG